MPRESHDLHGSAPDKSNAVLLLIDVINDFDFPEGDELLRLAMPVGKNIAELKKRAKAAGMPVIYVNDNFGRWQSDFKKIIAHCTKDDAKGKSFVEPLVPDDDDYFVLKPKHSGFYSTTLDLLLTHLGAKNLILTGIAGNKIAAFAWLKPQDLDLVRACIATFGSVYTGFWVSAAARTQFNSDQPWTTTSKSSRLLGGHCVEGPPVRRDQPGPAEEVAAVQRLDGDGAAAGDPRLERDGALADDVEGVGGLTLAHDLLGGGEDAVARAAGERLPLLGAQGIERGDLAENLLNRPHRRPSGPSRGSRRSPP